MVYYLNYIVTLNKKRIDQYFGHSSLGITQYNPNDPDSIRAKTIMRVGLNSNNQIFCEERLFCVTNPNLEFKHKTYPISQIEFENFCHITNQDRTLNPDSSPIRYGEPINRTLKYQSRPGGPKLKFLTNNCKSHTLSVLKRLGINDRSLSNMLFDIPRYSGDLSPAVLTEDRRDTGIDFWQHTMAISERKDYSSFTESELEELKQTKIFSETQIKIEKYMNNWLHEAQQILKNDARYKFEKNILAMLNKHPNKLEILPKGLQLIAKKYDYAEQLRTLLNDTSTTLQARYKKATAFLSDPNVSQTLETSRGFWAWLRDVFKLKSNGAKLADFVKKQEAIMARPQADAIHGFPLKSR